MPSPISVLAKATASHVNTSPFAHAMIDEVFDAEHYDQLSATFPAYDTFTRIGTPDGSSRTALRIGAREALADPELSEEWRTFFDYHTSEAFWQDILDLMEEPLRAVFPGLENRVGRPFREWRVKRRDQDGDAELSLDLLFVTNPPVVKTARIKGPHVDRRPKIFSGLFYMRDENDTSTGADLDFYKFTRPPVFDKHKAMAAHIKKTGTVSYRANRYVCFVNSEKAVHGVSLRSPCPVARRYINFVAEMPFDAFEIPQISLAGKLFNFLDRSKADRRDISSTGAGG